jgi:hypothetical protein
VTPSERPDISARLEIFLDGPEAALMRLLELLRDFVRQEPEGHLAIVVRAPDLKIADAVKFVRDLGWIVLDRRPMEGETP